MNFQVQILIDTIKNRRMHLNYKQQYIASNLYWQYSHQSFPQICNSNCVIRTLSVLINKFNVLFIDIYYCLSECYKSVKNT